MKAAALHSAGIAISLVSGFLVLALVAELYYLLWWKKKKRIPKSEEENKLYHFFCWKNPTTLNPQETRINSDAESDSVLVDAEFMGLHSLPGPPRFLFTIKEETREELEECSVETETPFMTPLSSPPFFTPPITPMQGFNPLFESFKNDSEMSRAKASNPSSSSSSPPPKFKFMRDAEEKLYRKILTEEAMRVRRATTSPPPPPAASDGSFVTVVIGKNRDSSLVNPLPSPE